MPPGSIVAPTPGVSGFAQIIVRIRSGDERALERLLAAIAIPMHRMAENLIGSSLRAHVDSGDLVQAVTLILWQGLRNGRFVVATPQQLAGLTRILLRRQAAKAARKHLPVSGAMAATISGDLGATIADQALPRSVDPAKKAETTEQIQQLMARVSIHDRRMLELLLSGHSIAAAARLLKVEPATLRMRLSRLRVRLRRVRHIRVKVNRVPCEHQGAEQKVVNPPASPECIPIALAHPSM